MLLCSSVLNSQSFTWARLEYPSRCPDESCLKSWYTDYPEADAHFVEFINKLTKVQANSATVKLSESRLFTLPFLYVVEPEQMNLSDKDATRLREWLHRGGFIWMDDFHGEEDWQPVVATIQHVLPKAQVIQLDVSHPLFDIFFHIPKIEQVLNDQILECSRAKECDAWENGPSGREPQVLGVYDGSEMKMLVTFNTDTGDGLEHVNENYYPLPMAAYAIRLAVNIVIYALSH